LVAWVVSGATEFSALLVGRVESTEVMAHFGDLRLFLLLVGSYCYLVFGDFHEEQTGSVESYS
jgi:hypothetical protein